MDILKDLQNMLDRSSAFAKRNEIEVGGSGRESGNVCRIAEIVAFQNELGEYVKYVKYEKSHKITVQEPKKSKKERGQRATAAIDESFYFPLGRS